MSLPPLVPVPPASIRLNIAPAEWEACLQAWVSLTDLYLQFPSKQISTATTKDGPVMQFLSSFYHEVATIESGDETFAGPTARQLRKSCFMLVRRIYLDAGMTGFMDFDFLTDVCRVYRKSVALSKLMSDLWRQREKDLDRLLQKEKSNIQKSSSKQDAQGDLRRVVDIMIASPDAALLFMTGSDFLDALVTIHGTTNLPNVRDSLVATTYFGLLGLIKATPPNLSLLTDHLYSLRTQADQKSEKPSLIAELVTNTPLLSKLTNQVNGHSSERLRKLLDTLATYRSPSIERPRKHVPHNPNKGKGRSLKNDEMHVHRMSLVTQLQDLFPDLGSGFVLRLLNEYEDDVEQVTAHLLDNSLPPHLQNLDRAEEAPVRDTNPETSIENLVPRSTPPPPRSSFVPDRRNVFDNDDFDRLEISASKLHIGKKPDQSNEGQANKAAILSALAAFDSDDDERDDTYDVEDVGGTVDSAHPDGEPGPAPPAAKATQEENDVTLFTAYKSTPELFGRSFNVRRSQPRQALKAETGMTDEAIEGWAIMLQRDPKRMKRLESMAAGGFDGGQASLPRTAYRESPGGTETEDSDVPAERGGFGGRGRGRGRGPRGGGGGNVAGPSGEASTVVAQRRKEANKGSRANHNRRDQRARKMARGGFAG